MKNLINTIILALLLVCAHVMASPTDPTKFDVVDTVTAGMAPTVAYFDARHLSSTRTDTLQWNFGDGTDSHYAPATGQIVNANTCLTAQIVGHYYASPGTYHCSCKIIHSDGTSVLKPFTVQVLEDARKQVYFDPKGNDSNDGSAAHPLLSSTRFFALAQTNNIHIRLASGMKLQLSGCIQLGSNVAIDGGGSTILLNPGAKGFAGAVGRTSDVFIHHLIFDCTNPVAGSELATLRGTRLAFVDCVLGNLDRGIEIEDNATDSVLLQGIVQTASAKMASQCMYIGGGHRVVELFNVLNHSTNESTDRADGTALDGSTIEYCDYSQPGQAKACCTRRVGNDCTVANSLFSNADLSFNVGIGDPSSMASVRITNTVVRSCKMNFGAVQATVQVSPGVMGITFRDNIINRNGPAFSVVPVAGQAPLTDVVLDNNVVTGVNARLLFSAQPAAVISSSTANVVNGAK